MAGTNREVSLGYEMLNAERETAGATGGESSGYQMIRAESENANHQNMSRGEIPDYLTLVDERDTAITDEMPQTTLEESPEYIMPVN